LPKGIGRILEEGQALGFSFLLYSGLIFNLVFYYSECEGLGLKFIWYVEFVVQEIILLLGEDSSIFYVSDGSKLKPRFAASMARLRD